jgi:hypothetical protein
MDKSSKFMSDQEREIEEIRARLNQLNDSLARLVIDEEKSSKMDPTSSTSKRCAAIEKLRSEVDRQERALEELMDEFASLNRERDANEDDNYVTAASTPFPYTQPGQERMKFDGLCGRRFNEDVYCPYKRAWRDGHCIGHCVNSPHHWAAHYSHYGHPHGCASNFTGYTPCHPCYRSGHSHNHGAHHCGY